ncbi:unannotated protein [freshwater metagenome]|uniref:Unannotated protein n=1 Tax=freshwater metagenome TaxID=449393 RepID=A0A6J7HBE8_9ZZZZ|nr:hypothetical protein [Actinomycetota bacterium]
MTDRAPQPQARRPDPHAAKRRTARRVFAVSGAAFAVVLGSLGIQMASGNDPLITPKPAASATVASVPAKRKVIIRRVVVTKHVTVVKYDRPASVQQQTSAPLQRSTSAPVQQQQTTTSVQQQAPAPVQQQAPAPVRTRTS